MMCYDLRACITSVIGNLELYQDAETPQENKQRMLERATKEARRAFDMTEGTFKAICAVDRTVLFPIPRPKKRPASK